REPWECTLKPRKGELFPASITVGQVRDGRGNVVGLRWLIRDVQDRVRAEQAALERGKICELGAEVGAALTESGPPNAILQRCAQAVARHLDAALAGIWTLNKESREFELQACAGLQEGVVKGSCLGKFKIDLIAEQGVPHLTNSLLD